MTVVPPGSTIGILGGGQLGRMTALAAARLGYRCHVFTPEPDAPTAQVAAQTTIADYGDRAALAAFARSVAVATYEFENIPEDGVTALAKLVPVRPSARVLGICQDRLKEKTFLNRIGVATTGFRAVDSAASLARARDALGAPAVLKTVRLGYDGKGQRLIRARSDLDAAWDALGAEHAILEAFVDFRCEISVIVARGLDGRIAAYEPVENSHKHHILDRTIVPARIPAKAAAKARAIARRIAKKLNLVGVLAVEMFYADNGAVLVNELAPRPHNSGHWTIDACVTSQFEQLVRAICGLPLGATERHADAVMQNLIGDDVRAWPKILRQPGAKLHLYGKREIRAGRKMGHVTYLAPRRA
ncbi:MAG: 5-(carboxyamino)imidazole ribonucleotide synthase [Proteobacteria bacterium]|nr:5-(carboxyamino)imidazole ribonucleotide synthase [Pseudomonadota bacterium]